MGVTIIIVVATCIVSFLAFSNQRLVNDLIFYPIAVAEQKQWYRFFSCGLIHADISHLAFNMISFYMFGPSVERTFTEIFGKEVGFILYALLYISALLASLIPTYSQHKHNYGYRSLGASGAVSAVVFASIFLSPDSKVGIIFIPIAFPGYIFGPIYLIATVYMSKRGGDNINHSAHLWGSLYGVAYVIVTTFALSDFNPFKNFIDRIFS